MDRYNATQQAMEKSTENLSYLNTQIQSMEERLKEEKNGSLLLKKRSEMFMKVSKQLLLKQDGIKYYKKSL